MIFFLHKVSEFFCETDLYFPVILVYLKVGSLLVVFPLLYNSLPPCRQSLHIPNKLPVLKSLFLTLSLTKKTYTPRYPVELFTFLIGIRSKLYLSILVLKNGIFLHYRNWTSLLSN